MSELHPLPKEIWEKTPVEAQALLLVFLKKAQQFDQLEKRIVELELEKNQQIEQLQKRVIELEERLKLNSTNSSKPPSSDPPSVKRPGRPKKKRKRGGQKGHKGHKRELLPTEEVDELVVLAPEKCAHCDHPLSGIDEAPFRHQVWEIPPVKPVVREYQLHQLTCPACQGITRVHWPEGVSQSAFGPRLQAMASLCAGYYFLSRRAIQRLMSDFFGVALSLGSISRLEEKTSEALAEPVEEAREYVQQTNRCNADETGYKEKTKQHWLWVVTTAMVSVFSFAASRGSKIIKGLLGEKYKGIVGTDRWSGYNWLPDERRQFCWAHLKREFEKWLLRGGKSAELGEILLKKTKEMFRNWHRVRDGTLSREVFKRRMEHMEKEVEHFLSQGAKGKQKKTAATCRELLKHKEALWVFVKNEGVEPTNNAAERMLRPSVLWKKRSFGTESPTGSRFVERMMTVVTTLNQQNRHVLDYVTAACEARLRGDSPPSLLPPQKNTP